MSSEARPPTVPHDEDLTPEEEGDLVRRAEEAEDAVQRGDAVPWDKLFPTPAVALDPDEDEDLARRLDEIPELDRRGHLRPVGDFLAELRAEIGQRRAG